MITSFQNLVWHQSWRLVIDGSPVLPGQVARGSLRLLTGLTLELDVLALSSRGPVQHLRLQIVARGTGDHQAPPYTIVMSSLTVSSEDRS